MDMSKCFTEFRLELNSSKTLYLQIADFLSGLITKGELPADMKLLPERELSSLLGVSRTTAINAYRNLEKRCLIQTKVGSGTYVLQMESEHKSSMPWNQLYVPLPQTSQASVLKELVSASHTSDHISLAAGMSDPSLYPLEIMRKFIIEELPKTSPTDFGHMPTEGYMPLREELTRLLNGKKIVARSEEVMISSGSQQGLYLLSKIFLEHGDYVITESPTYIGAIQSFQAAGARLLTVPSLDRLDLGLIEDYLIRYRPKLFYISPTYQNPTGRVISLEERQRLIRLAAKHRLIIVEDDAYGDLYYSQKPPVPIKAIDSYGGVIYLGTFSKILFPGMRTGWIVANSEVIRRLASEKQYIDLHSNNWTQWLLTLYLKQNYLEGHLEKIRGEYKKRRDTVVQAIYRYCDNDLKFDIPDGGFYLWCTVESACSPRLLWYEAGQRGVSFVPGEAFYSNPMTNHEIRLCYTAHSPERLTEGVKRLSQAIKDAARGNIGKRVDSTESMPII